MYYVSPCCFVFLLVGPLLVISVPYPWPALTLYLCVHSGVQTTPLSAVYTLASLAHMALTLLGLHPHFAACPGPMDIPGAAGAPCRSAWQDQH
jgi:hypothetical protein